MLRFLFLIQNMLFLPYYVITPVKQVQTFPRFDGVEYGDRSENIKDVNDLYVNSRSEGFGDEVKRR